MAVPWSRLAWLAPIALGLARELLARKQDTRGEPPKDPEPRIAALEETQRREAEAVNALAEQAAALAEAAVALRRQVRIALVVAIAGAALAAAALAVATLR